jgi:hypothetical protein
MSLSLLHAYVHVACLCPCCMSCIWCMSMCAAYLCPFCMLMTMLNASIYLCSCCMAMSMEHVHVHDTCTLFMQHVHVHVACPCPCGTSMPILYVRVHAACTSVYMLYVPVYVHSICPRPCCICPSHMSIVHVACPCSWNMSIFMLHVRVHAMSMSQVMSMLRVHVHVRAPCTLSMLHWHVMLHVHVQARCPCPLCMSLSIVHVHVNDACQCLSCMSISMLEHRHETWTLTQTCNGHKNMAMRLGRFNSGKKGSKILGRSSFNRRGRRETKKVNTTFGNIISSDLFHQFRQTVLFRIIQLRFLLFRFREMSLSRNTKFCEVDNLFREIKKIFSLPFCEISRNKISLDTLLRPSLCVYFRAHLPGNVLQLNKETVSPKMCVR